MSTEPTGRRTGAGWVDRVRRSPVHSAVWVVGGVLLAGALVFGVRWSAVGHAVGRLSWVGWCAIAGAALVLGAAVRLAWRRSRGTTWTRTRWGWTGLVIVAPLIVLTVLALLLLFASVDTTQAQVRIDVIKTALSIGAGAGAVAALLLASRKQWSTERADYNSQHDATERRITELYTKAAEQLGSEKAPVRLAGLYALERLAQDNQSQRQTIVNLLCAYLRMPYQPPEQPPEDADEKTIQDHRERVQEREVRLTAQRLLAEHLRPGDDDNPAPTFWPNIDLDLTGALLTNFNMANCQARNADFESATFTGNAYFGSTTFTGTANFGSATFTGTAYFESTTFTGNANFGSTTFTRDAYFWSTTFTGDTYFGSATFTGDAYFTSATFTRNAFFESTTFTGKAANLADPNRESPYTDFRGATFQRGEPNELTPFLTARNQEGAGDQGNVLSDPVT